MGIRDLQVTNDTDQSQNRGGFQWGIRLDFLHFDGKNSSAWIFKASQYFEYHQTALAALAQCLLITSYHMEGEAVIWYEDAINTSQFNN